MSLFVNLRSSPAVRLRIVGDEIAYPSKVGGIRYARLVYNYGTDDVEIFAYSFPVRKQLPDRMRERDIVIRVSGHGKDVRYEVEALKESELSRFQLDKIQASRLDVRRWCK